jgi:hypothetical protein
LSGVRGALRLPRGPHLLLALERHAEHVCAHVARTALADDLELETLRAIEFGPGGHPATGAEFHVVGFEAPDRAIFDGRLFAAREKLLQG